MKRLTTVLVAVLLGLMISGTAIADTLKIIIPGGGSGSYNTRFQILKSEIETVWGDDVKVVWANNCTRARALLNKETGPALTIWQAGYNLNPACALPISRHEVLAVEVNYLRLCSSATSGRAAVDLITSGATFTVAHSDPHDAYGTWFKKFNAAMGTNLQAVPYGSSGKARQGVLAGDVDFVFISPSNSNKLMQQGGFCFYTTAPAGEPSKNLPPLATVAPDFSGATINQAYYYPVFNMPTEKFLELQNLFDSVANGKHTKFTKFALTKDIFMKGFSNLDRKGMIDLIEETVDLWRAN